MIFELFIVGSFWYWLLMVATGVALYYYIDDDRGIGATLTLLATALLVWLFGNFNAFAWVWHRPVHSLIGVGAYFLIGVIWSFAKWFLFNRERAEKVVEAREAFVSERTLPTPENIYVDEYRKLSVDGYSATQRERRSDEEIANIRKAKYKSEIDSYNESYQFKLRTSQLSEKGADGKYSVKPWVRNHKAKITTWITYWPFSMTWALIDDVVRNVTKSIYNALSSKYQSVSDRVFKNVDDRPFA